MIQKPYGKFTLEQFKELGELVRETQSLAPTLEQVFGEADPEKLKTILGENFSWWKYYEMPFNDHIAWSVLILDWQDELQKAASSVDPQQAFMDFMNSPEADKDWSGGFQGRFEKKDLVAVVISILKTIKSIMIYQKSLSALVEETSQGNDKALFNAVRIDPTVIGCPTVMHRISIAAMKGDKSFIRELKGALDGPTKKYQPTIDLLRYMMLCMTDTGVVKMSGPDLESLFVDHLKLYSKQATAQKNLYEQFLNTKRVNHMK